MTMADTSCWKLQGSRESKDAINPIRMCTETHYVDAVKKAKKDLYKLAIGMVHPQQCSKDVYD